MIILEKFLSSYDSSFEGQLYFDNLEHIQLVLGGQAFNQGLFRIYNLEDGKKWTLICKQYFPNIDIDFDCFAFDWAGRQFAISKEKDVSLLFDHSTGEYFVLKALLNDFFNIDLIEYKEETLNVDRFMKLWFTHQGKLRFNEILGFKVPLFLGGQDILNNYEIQDCEIDWEINKQLFNKFNS